MNVSDCPLQRVELIPVCNPIATYLHNFLAPMIMVENTEKTKNTEAFQK